MADYDIYSNVKPVPGTAAEVVMDGTTYTDAIDTFDWKSCVFLCSIHALAAYDDCSWAMRDSDDGSTWTDVDSEMILSSNPSDGTRTSKAFHAGYRGKKRWVKAAFECDGTTEGAIDYTEAAAVTPASLTRSSTTVTVTKASHGLVAGQYVTIAGATQTAYNGTFRIATVPDSDTFTYTADSTPSASPATGTITCVARTYWDGDEGADIPATITVGDDALNGDYVITVDHVSTGSTAYTLTKGASNTGNGTVTVGTITRAGANAIFEEAIRIVCTAAASNAGTFTVYREDDTSLGTITVGGGATTIQVGGVNAFAITIADGSADWIVGDILTLRITDLGKNRYVLTDPDGTVVGYPMGATAFTSDHLSFTIPDSTVAVSDAAAELTITVTHGLAKGQIMAVLGNPISGPIFSEAIET